MQQKGSGWQIRRRLLRTGPAEKAMSQSAVIATAEACPIVLKLTAIAVFGRPVIGFSWMTLMGHAGSGV